MGTETREEVKVNASCEQCTWQSRADTASIEALDHAEEFGHQTEIVIKATTIFDATDAHHN